MSLQPVIRRPLLIASGLLLTPTTLFACPPGPAGLEQLIREADQVVIAPSVQVRRQYPTWLYKAGAIARDTVLGAADSLHEDAGLLAEVAFEKTEAMIDPESTLVVTAKNARGLVPEGPAVPGRVAWKWDRYISSLLIPDQPTVVFLKTCEETGKLFPVESPDAFRSLLSGSVDRLEEVIREGFAAKEGDDETRRRWRRKALFTPEARTLMVADELRGHFSKKTLVAALVEIPGGLWTDLEIARGLADFESLELDLWSLELAQAMVASDLTPNPMPKWLVDQALDLAIDRALGCGQHPAGCSEDLGRDRHSVQQALSFGSIPAGELTRSVDAWKELTRLYLDSRPE
ncbi:MAG: hypothetical protein AAF725_23785 [Acidobacteriota bacterium]